MDENPARQVNFDAIDKLFGEERPIPPDFLVSRLLSCYEDSCGRSLRTEKAARP